MGSPIIQNPIIDAYMQGIQLKRQQEQTEFERNLQTQQQKMNQEQLKGYLSHLGAEESATNARISLERATHEMQARQMLMQGLSSGQIRPQMDQNGQAQPVQMGDVSVNPNEVASPEYLQNLDLQYRKKLGIQEGDQKVDTQTKLLGAEEPFQKRAEERANTYKLGQISAEGKNAMDRTLSEVEGKKAVAGIEGRYSLDRARIMMFGGLDMDTPDKWSQTVLPYALGQAEKPLGNSPKDLIIRQHLQSNDLRELDKKTGDSISHANKVDDIYNYMDQLVDQLPTSKVLANGQHQLAKVSGSDAANLDRQVGALALPLLQGMGVNATRILKSELDRVKGIMSATGMTQEQAKSNIDLGRKVMRGGIMDDLMGGYSPKQQLLVLKSKGMDPASFNTGVDDGKGKKIKRFHLDEKDHEWTAYNSKTGVYESLDAQ